MTFTPEEGAQIFKRDTMGRVRLPRTRREELLDEYERSGISGVQYAAYIGIKYSTLANWIQKRERRAGSAKYL
jgi:DNA-binding transcriptional regulator YiaG